MKSNLDSPEVYLETDGKIVNLEIISLGLTQIRKHLYPGLYFSWETLFHILSQLEAI